MKRNSYGAGIADKPVKRTEQKHCACGAPVAARKARCWDCEDKLHTARRNERRSRNRSGAADSRPAKAPGDRGAALPSTECSEGVNGQRRQATAGSN